MAKLRDLQGILFHKLDSAPAEGLLRSMRGRCRILAGKLGPGRIPRDSFHTFYGFLKAFPWDPAGIFECGFALLWDPGGFLWGWSQLPEQSFGNPAGFFAGVL